MAGVRVSQAGGQAQRQFYVNVCACSRWDKLDRIFTFLASRGRMCPQTTTGVIACKRRSLHWTAVPSCCRYLCLRHRVENFHGTDRIFF